MKSLKWYYFSLLALLLFEFLRVYFIMPLPGSQKFQTVEIAYGLHQNRWLIRSICCLLILLNLHFAYQQSKIKSMLFLVFVIFSITFIETQMMSDTMFYQPKQLILKNSSENKIPLTRQIIGIQQGQEAKAYPISFLTYHHQVRDQINGQDVLISYCSVCRSGRVFIPKVNGQTETFRLVGMDQFNAMFEDSKTGSWWRQENGEAITGPLKGQMLELFPSTQLSLAQWLTLYPDSKIMQADPAFNSSYDSLALFEQGKSKGSLTKSDTSSWGEKSWVIGISKNNEHLAIDWNRLQREKQIVFNLGGQNCFITLTTSNTDYFAFEVPFEFKNISLKQDTIFLDQFRYCLNGNCIDCPETDTSKNLISLPAYQEFWHSWRTFHSNSQIY